MDYTEAQLKEAARKAYDAGDIAAAKRFIDAARKVAASVPIDQGVETQPASTETAAEQTVPDRTLGETIYENLIGSGAVDTPGERAAELISGLGAGALRGGAQLVGLPGTIDDMLDKGVTSGINALFGTDLKGRQEPSILSGQNLQNSIANLTGNRSEYVAPGTAGKYAATVGEFLPGGMLSGPSGILRYGVIPGVASEAAGQLTEGTPIEPYARTVSPIIASLLAGRPGAFAGKDESTRMANVLRDAGVDVTAGQAAGSQALMRMEGMLQATDKQLADFTAATMAKIGSTAKTALPENIAAAKNSIVKQMDDAVAGVDIIPTPTQAQVAEKVASDYAARAPSVQLTPRIRGIANEIKSLAGKGKDISLAKLKEWRSDIGDFTVSSDAATRNAAHQLRELIDDITDQALTAAGRVDDIADLAKARESYRDFLAVQDAATRGAHESGILSPTQLNQSMIRAQGRENYATGRTTPMVDFTRSGASVLRPAPTVSHGAFRRFSEAIPAAAAAAGGGAAFGAGLGPMGIVASILGGSVAPAVGRMAMRSAPVQAMLRDPKGTLAQLSRIAPGLLSTTQP